MMDEDLERAIRAATPGPWMGEKPDARMPDEWETPIKSMDGKKVITTGWNGVEMAAADVAFIAALNPEAALALLNRARAAEHGAKALAGEVLKEFVCMEPAGGLPSGPARRALAAMQRAGFHVEELADPEGRTWRTSWGRDPETVAIIGPSEDVMKRAQTAEAKLERLRLVGTGLANAAYNLKQQNYIPEEHRRSLDEGQRAWDAALRDQGKSPLTIPARRPTRPGEAPEDQLARIAAVLGYEGPEDGLVAAVERHRAAALELGKQAQAVRTALACDHGGAEHIQAVEEARRAGAAEIREQARLEAAKEEADARAQCSADPARINYWDARRSQARTLAKRIEALDLPDSPLVKAERRAALETALKLAADVEREELAGGREVSASGAEEVKDRIQERIQRLDEGME